MNCQNCGNPTVQNFCSNCGQKRITKRLSLSEFKNDIISTFFNYESVLFKTIFKIFTNPKQVVSDYFYGKRKSYFNPIKLLFIVLTIKTILEFQLNKNTEQSRLAFEIINSEYWKLIEIIVLVPLYSFFSYFLFKKYKYNFAEHLVINAYFLSITSIFVIFIYLLKMSNFFDFRSGQFSLIIGLIIMIWLYANLYRNKVLITILKTILIVFLGMSILFLSIVFISELIG